MKKSDLVDLFNGLVQVSNIAGKKFGYAVARNISVLKPHVTTFEDAKTAIVKNFSKKDEQGEPSKDEKGFVLENPKDADKEYKALLAEEVEVELFKIKIDEVPEAITGGQLTGIYPIIE